MMSSLLQAYLCHAFAHCLTPNLSAVFCRRMWGLLQLHAKQCQSADCPVPRCRELREMRRRQMSRQEDQRRHAYQAMLRQQASSRQQQQQPQQGQQQMHDRSQMPVY